MNERCLRKKELIARGALQRAELMLARETVRAAAQPAALGRSLLQHLVARLSGKAGAGLDLAAVLPVALSAASALGRRRALPGLLTKGGAIAAAAAAALVFLRRRRDRHSPGEDL